MTALLDTFAANPLLTVFTVLALGTLVGAIPLGPIKLGPAGGLFVGLAVGAIDPRLGEDLGLLQTLGLALFVYTVGLSVGYVFFTTLKRQFWVLLAGGVALAAAVAVSVAGGRLLGLSAPMVAGTLAGATTSTPALAAATQAAGGSGEPAVGNALGYPVGVLVTILVLVVVTSVKLPGRRDPKPVTSGGLVASSVDVQRSVSLEQVPGWRDQLIQMSYLVRDGHGRVVTDDETLREGDHVLVIGSHTTLGPAVDFLGSELSTPLTDDRTDVDHRVFTVSNPEVAGRTLGDIGLREQYGGRVTRVFRGDTEILARDDLMLALGDRVLAVLPAGSLDSATSIFGDSDRKVSEIDPLSLGVGMALGLGLGALSIPIGDASFTLGAAAGPLVVGMILGRVRRTGHLVWSLPHSANLTLRQLGLALFLACVGLGSGQAFASTAFSATGLAAGVLAAVITLTVTVVMWAGAAGLGLSSGRAAGLVSGIIGQPALLVFAQQRVQDERVETGYSTVFAIGLVAKTVLAYFLAGAY